MSTIAGVKAAVFIASTLLGAVAAVGGPLTPPPGAVSSTGKPLSQVEPRSAITALPMVINAAGSYYLTDNLSIPANQVGIQVNASGVTIDLSGFTINGNGVSGDGIDVASSARGVTIRNGSITNVGGCGIDAASGSADLADGLTVEGVRVLTAGSRGITGSRGATIRNCYVNGAQIGIRAGFSSKVLSCTVEFATQTGFIVEGGSMLEACVAVGTAGGPTNGRGFVFGAGNVAENCVARSNTGAGFAVSDQALLRGCSSTANTGAGFVLGSDSRLETCSAIANAGAGVTGNLIRNWEINGCIIRVPANGTCVNITGQSHTGKVVDCTLAGPFGFPATATGVFVNDSLYVTVTRNTFTSMTRGVVIDSSNNTITANVFAAVGSPVTTSIPGLILLSNVNVIGPMVDFQNAATSTNPLANIKHD
jgi:parallel beta-helix repeat protein